MVTKEELEKLINVDKLSYAAIGRQLSCTGTKVKQIANTYGIEIKRLIDKNQEYIHKGLIFNSNGECKHCKSSLKRKNATFCSFSCRSDHQYKDFIWKWKKNLVDGRVGLTVSTHIRRYLHEKYDSCCSQCGWSQINNKSKTIPLQVHHIDGNYLNCVEDNLDLLCPNCHTLTENFGALNKQGRKSRNASS